MDILFTPLMLSPLGQKIIISHGLSNEITISWAIGPGSRDQRWIRTGQISRQSFQEHICHPPAMPGQHVHKPLHFPWRKHAIQHYVTMYKTNLTLL